MTEFPEVRIPIGDVVENFIDFLAMNFEAFFDFIFVISSSMIKGLEAGLLAIPWWIFIIIIFLLGWYFTNLYGGLLFGLFIFLIGTFDLWPETMTTISIVLISVILSLVIGIPLGVGTAFSKTMSTIMRPVLDAMQTMPSFVYLIPVIFFFPLGNVPAVIATIIYALPPVIRLTELGIRNVDKEVVESAQSFGSSTSQMLMKVQLPQALPTIMAGVNQTTMMALSMAVVGSMVGAQGLGERVLYAINRIDISLGFEAGISIVFLAIIIDRITGGIANRLQKHRRDAA
ncbi:ABC transporter permease [Psychrobacillus psychrodurans]|jgi:glycine betaine/proline transport system permease protein|uniref:ABC transporter permease n=1 Tax=Psychrobacillus psychrodurans TaxID=126157 RepID=UPI0008F45497|nr:proline/glycine betaine ABC transporter permease [Psychrobacillus psychrodurans]MCZ8540719.1 proline/glycine betaine ABC transporter permease [Psychrobacillus psychrodurans]SFM73975.1 glycine betaine/proline transport system permease protein [Psychrobacillus psychrodurans]